MSTLPQPTQALFEIAMAIGPSMDLQAMLEKSIGTMLRELNCTGGVIFADRCRDRPCRLEELFATPDTVRLSPVYRAAAEDLTVSEVPGTGRTDWSAPEACPASDAFYYLFDLAGFGVLVLLREHPLDSELARSLRPIFDKLAECCITCETVAARADNWKELRQQESRFRELVESSSDWIWEVNSEGVYTYASPKIEEILGYTPEEIVGTTPFSFMPPEEADRIAGVFRDLAARGEPIVALENVNLHKDGRRIVLETSGIPLLDQAGKLSGYRGVDRDVTDRKRAEEALRESEERFRLIFDNYPLGAAVVSADFSLQLVNAQLCEITGYSEQELLSSSIAAIVHPDDLAADMEMGRRMISGEIDQYDREERCVRKDGQVIWVRISAATVRDAQGHPVYFLTLIQDITERLQAEQAVAQERNLSNLMIDSLPGMFYLFDQEGRFLRWNKNLETITGYSAEEIRQRRALDYFDDADRDHVEERIGEVFRTGYATVEANVVAKDGRATPFFLTGKQIEFDGRPCLIGMGLDLTERKRAEEAVAQERNLSNRMIDSLPGIFYLIDQDGRYLRWNENLETVSGYSAEEISRMHPLEFFRGADCELIAERIARVYESGEADAEADLVAKDGQAYPYYFTGKRIEFDGRPCLIGMGIDVTERKRAEDALRESEERYRMAQRVSGVGTWEWNVATNEVFWSDEVVELWGFEPGQFSGRYDEVAKSVHPEDRDRWLESVRACIEDGREHNIEFRVVLPDGTVRWIVAMGDTQRDEHGTALRMIGVVRDVTERKLAEEALRESEEKYRTVFQSGSQGFFLMTDVFVDCNEQGCRLFACSRRDVIGRSPVDFSPPVQPDGRSSPAAARDYLDAALAGTPQRFYWQHRRMDGVLIDCEITLDALSIGGQALLLASLTDITERRQAESALRESEAKLREAQQMAGLGHWFWDVKAGDVEWSEEVYRVFRLAPETFTPQIDSIMALSPWPEDHQRHQELIRRAIQSREKGSFEQRFLRPDGSTGYYFSTFQGIYDDAGELVAMKGTVQDITERKLANEELLRLRNYLSNIIDSMPSVLVGVDLENVVTQWNSEAQQTTGVSAADAIGQPLVHVFPRLAAEMEYVQEAMRTRQVCSDSRRAYKVKDETRYEDITVYPLLANGIEGAVIRLDDVTERVRIEEMMIQSEKMLSVGGLAAGMAHEINNPLAGMVQTASVMRDRLTNLQLPANRSAAEEAGTSMQSIYAFMETRGILGMLDRIRQSGSQAAKIVGNMLSFARKSDSGFLPHSLPELLDQTIDLASSEYDLKKKYDFRQIEIVRQYDDDVPKVPCEASKIQQVLLNIFRNGAEAMQTAAREQAGGTQGAKPRFVLRLAHEKEAHRVRIEIEDNGPGMDEATRRRIFEPFFTTKPTNRGTGLGLSVSYFIITENHRGEMSVKSAPGEGTTFILRLPTRKSEP